MKFLDYVITKLTRLIIIIVIAVVVAPTAIVETTASCCEAQTKSALNVMKIDLICSRRLPQHFVVANLIIIL